MSATESKAAYQDCFDYFDRALIAKLGVRIPVSDPSAASHLRVRMHKARAISRRENDAVFNRSLDHPEYNTSPYDALVIKIREKPEGKWWLYIETRKTTEVEELTDETEADADASARDPMVLRED